MSRAGGGSARGGAASPRLFGFPPAGALGAGAVSAEAAGIDFGDEPSSEPSPEPRFLVLGSFPSAQSLARREYYGNPRNHFWRIVAICFGKPEPRAYGDKLALLREGRIALWDAYAACERHGSLDKDIAAGTPNPIVRFIALHPTIEAVGLNGGAAAAAFLAGIPGGVPLPRLARSGDSARWTPGFDQARTMRVARLPSTSPIPTAGFKTAEDKFPLWKRFFTIHL